MRFPVVPKQEVNGTWIEFLQMEKVITRNAMQVWWGKLKRGMREWNISASTVIHVNLIVALDLELFCLF